MEMQLFVSFKGNNSDFQNVTFGVPHGIVLGPLLSILYTISRMYLNTPNAFHLSMPTSHNLTYLRESV